MKIKKTPFVLSFALATALVAGQAAFAAPGLSDNGNDFGNMMNGEGVSQMMDFMASPEGQEMVKACSNAMSSFSDQAKAD